MTRVTAALALGLSLSLAACRVPARSEATPVTTGIKARARNAILFIGDGMGDAEITIARNYHVGAAGRLAMDELPFTGDCTTYAIDEDEPHRPVYVADSAAGGTALATGVKTSNRRISTAPKSGEPLTTIVELAQRAGLTTGIVTTTDLSDATPACFATHVNHRYCRGPGEMKLCPQDMRRAGGRGPIVEQLATSGVDVILGGGRNRFDRPLRTGPNRGRTARDAAVASGYRIVDSRAALLALDEDEKSAPGGSRVLGLFAAEDFDPVWTGEFARPDPGSAPQICKEGQRPQEEPSLAEMTRIALARLDRRAADARGFFLMVEGGVIDKRDHLGDVCGQIGETIDLDQAVKVATDYARKWGDTLVIVTADHAHSSQSIPSPEENRSPGMFSRLTTHDGAELIVNYGTGTTHFVHTGTQVRVAAMGPRGESLAGLVDHTDVFKVIVAALGL